VCGSLASLSSPLREFVGYGLMIREDADDENCFDFKVNCKYTNAQLSLLLSLSLLLLLFIQVKLTMTCLPEPSIYWENEAYYVYGTGPELAGMLGACAEALNFEYNEGYLVRIDCSGNLSAGDDQEVKAATQLWHKGSTLRKLAASKTGENGHSYGEDRVRSLTKKDIIRRLFKAGLQQNSVLLDLGSGSGVVMALNGRNGHVSIGLDDHQELIDLSKEISDQFYPSRKLEFAHERVDTLNSTDLYGATNVSMYWGYAHTRDKTNKEYGSHKQLVRTVTQTSNISALPLSCCCTACCFPVLTSNQVLLLHIYTIFHSCR
jgi:hypothetical protein